MFSGLFDGFVRLYSRRFEVILLLILAALRIVGVDTSPYLRLPLAPELIIHLLQLNDTGLVKIRLLPALRTRIDLHSWLPYF